MGREPYSYEELERWAFQDELTGLSNRRHLVETIKDRATYGVPSFFLAIDLDGFKAAQDAHPEGHAYGDRVLRCFADFLRRITRKGFRTDARTERHGLELHQKPWRKREPDIVAFRPGGDEFVVIVDDLRGVERLSREIVAWSFDGIRASVGVGTTLAQADERLYAMKHTVRTAVVSAVGP